MPDDSDIKKLQEDLKKLQEENKDLKSAKGQADLEKAVAEAQRAAIVARMPPSDTKPLEGKVTVDAGAVTEVQRLAHQAMSSAAGTMAADIVSANPKTVVIYNETDVTAVTYYSTVMIEIRLLREGYHAAYGEDTGEHGPEAAAAAMPLIFSPAVAGAAIKSVIDLLALFRTNVEVKGAAVTFEDASVVAETASQLRNKDKSLKVIYTALIPTGSLDGSGNNNSELLKDLRALAVQRQRAAADVTAFEAKTDDQKKANPDEEVRTAYLKALNAGYDQLLSGMAQVGEDKTNLSSLSLLLRGESLARRMENKGSAILFVRAVGGGESRIRQNLLVGGKLYYRGTAILTYLLFDNSGELLRSDVLAESTAFAKFEI